MIWLYVLISIFSLILLFALMWLAFYLICSLVVDTSKEYTDLSGFYRRILNFATLTATVVLRIKVKTIGKEKLDPKQKYLFVSNHRSNLDPILSWYAFKEFNIAFVSKPENFKAPIFGRIIHRCGFIPINRQDPFKAVEALNKASSLLEKSEMSVGIYPEGTRNRKNDLLPFHNGVFRIAQKAKVPIAVVSVKNTDDVNKNIPFRKTVVYLEVAEVIPTEEIIGQRTNAVGDRIKEILEKNLCNK